MQSIFKLNISIKFNTQINLLLLIKLTFSTIQ
jgi:hypothetical protein